MAIVQLKKNEFPIFIDTSATETPIWSLVGLSKEQPIAMNPQSESIDYVCYESPVELVKSNDIEIATDLALREGDSAFDFMYAKFKTRPTGEDCKVTVLVCFAGTAIKSAWKGTATILFDELNQTDDELTFSLKLGGEIIDGTYTITAGVPTFTATV